MSFKTIITRLKKPSVILSIVSQVGVILALLNISVDMDMVTSIVAALCSVMVALGIMSNPSTKKKGFGDDIYFCQVCNAKQTYAQVGGKMVCSHCGTALQETQLDTAK